MNFLNHYFAEFPNKGIVLNMLAVLRDEYSLKQTGTSEARSALSALDKFRQTPAYTYLIDKCYHNFATGTIFSTITDPDGFVGWFWNESQQMPDSHRFYGIINKGGGIPLYCRWNYPCNEEDEFGEDLPLTRIYDTRERLLNAKTKETLKLLERLYEIR